jgi:hypothetical protein
MKLYVNEKGEIQDVGVTEDTSLREIVVSDEMFEGWSIAKICCYKIIMENNKVKDVIPYVSTNIIDKIDRLEKGNEINASDITSTQIAIAETYEKTLATDSTVTDIQLALVEMYEMMLGGD